MSPCVLVELPRQDGSWHLSEWRHESRMTGSSLEAGVPSCKHPAQRLTERSVSRPASPMSNDTKKPRKGPQPSAVDGTDILTSLLTMQWGVLSADCAEKGCWGRPGRQSCCLNGSFSLQGTGWRNSQRDAGSESALPGGSNVEQCKGAGGTGGRR